MRWNLTYQISKRTIKQEKLKQGGVDGSKEQSKDCRNQATGTVERYM
jgi:hypothetical protein